MFSLLATAAVALGASGLPETVARVKPAVVAVGTTLPIRRPPDRFLGSGFAVSDGRHVITNLHVIPETLDLAHKERLMVFTPAAGGRDAREATVVARDGDHDLVLLVITGEPLPTLELGDSSAVREGEACAFTGFPLGLLLGFHPVTHRGIVSSITPVVIPAGQASRLDEASVRLMRSPYDVFQLDATAYPGNSGSPLFEVESGRVIGIVNMVLLQASKEKSLPGSSAISYAIPAVWAQKLIASELGGKTAGGKTEP